jgi:hypothetical protein
VGQAVIEQPTVFVLGAGASENYGFPVGRELTRRITDSVRLGQLRDDGPVLCLVQMGFKREQIKEFIETLRRSAQSSVDAFLEHRKEYEKVGKAFIAWHLIVHEIEPNLYLGKDNWYRYVLDRMATSFDGFSDNRVSFVTFNYDRSLEHFFYVSLLNRYGKTPEETAHKVRSIPIVHVHGHLGLLEWQATEREQQSQTRAYAHGGDSEMVRTAAQGIQIVHEAKGNTTEFTRARELLCEAKRVYFLGFGYHPDNMRRLHVPFGRPLTAGSCFGYTEAEKRRLRETYNGLSLAPSGLKTLEFLRNEETFQKD